MKLNNSQPAAAAADSLVRESDLLQLVLLARVADERELEVETRNS